MPYNKTKNLILKIREVIVSIARNIVAKTCRGSKAYSALTLGTGGVQKGRDKPPGPD